MRGQTAIQPRRACRRLISIDRVVVECLPAITCAHRYARRSRVFARTPRLRVSNVLARRLRCDPIDVAEDSSIRDRMAAHGRGSEAPVRRTSARDARRSARSGIRAVDRGVGRARAQRSRRVAVNGETHSSAAAAVSAAMTRQDNGGNENSSHGESGQGHEENRISFFWRSGVTEKNSPPPLRFSREKRIC